MRSAELAEKIAALPDPTRAHLERYVHQLSTRRRTDANDDFVERLRTIRERIFHTYGYLGDSAEEIRHLREEGR